MTTLRGIKRKLTPINALPIIGRTLYNWRELWFFPLVALLQLILLIKLATWLTGHPPKEGANVLVGLGYSILYCVCAISLVSILKESSGRWWTKEQLKNLDRKIAIAVLWTEAIVKIAALSAFLYTITHA